MASKHLVIALAARGLTSVEIAAELGCYPEYVRATAIRNGITLKKCKIGPRLCTPETWAARVIANADEPHRAALRAALA